MFVTNKYMSVAAFCLGISIGIGGCNVEGRRELSHSRSQPGSSATRPAKPDRAGTAVDLSIADSQEVDLVEAVLTHRAKYHEHLRQLHDYYKATGYISKQNWAAFELEGLRSVKQCRYLLDAEVPSDALQPIEQIEEADALYEQGRELMRSGGHGVRLVYRQDRMIEAAERFRELIERFPSSDKIDDAAFLCGEIHKEYMPGQEQIAVKWYERAWTWDPQTPHPARFQAAVVYDYRLHDRDRALELYQNVLRLETADKGNVRAATRRIQELTSEARTVKDTANP